MGRTQDEDLKDPKTALWTLTGRTALARFDHSAIALADGSVLVAGGSYDVSEA